MAVTSALRCGIISGAMDMSLRAGARYHLRCVQSAVSVVGAHSAPPTSRGTAHPTVQGPEDCGTSVGWPGTQGLQQGIDEIAALR